MDLESATVLAFQYLAQNPHLLQGVEARQSLKDFADLVAVAHPTKLCVRASCCHMSAEHLQSCLRHCLQHLLEVAQGSEAAL